MIRNIFICASILLVSFTAYGKKKEITNPKPEQHKVLSSKIDSVSYALGINVAEGLLKDIKQLPGEQIKIDVFLDAFSSFINEQETKLPTNEAVLILQTYFMEEQQKAMNESLEKEKVYLEKNAQKEGVTTTESGLQYEVITMGNGPKPSASDKVRVHYHGTTTDGTVFDSSVQRGESIVFPLSGVIKGWTEVLQLMPVGSKWKVTIPSNLAYGERGAGELIGPNATLIFEIELIGIEN